MPKALYRTDSVADGKRFTRHKRLTKETADSHQTLTISSHQTQRTVQAIAVLKSPIHPPANHHATKIQALLQYQLTNVKKLARRANCEMRKHNNLKRAFVSRITPGNESRAWITQDAG